MPASSYGPAPDCCQLEQFVFNALEIGVVLGYGSLAMMLSDSVSSLSCRAGRSLYACGISGFTAARTWAPRHERELCSTSFRAEQASLKQVHGQPDPPVRIRTLTRGH